MTGLEAAMDQLTHQYIAHVTSCPSCAPVCDIAFALMKSKSFINRAAQRLHPRRAVAV